MGGNLWGVSPLYVNPVYVLNTLTIVIADYGPIFFANRLVRTRMLGGVGAGG
jgi:hypothetical protein